MSLAKPFYDDPLEDRNVEVSFQEALRRIMESAHVLGSEEISILESTSRILREDIVSKIKIPPLDDSAMDGYAVIASDTARASADSPVVLRIVSEIKAGDSPGDRLLTHGNAVRIMTGAPISQGADSVVRFEDTEEENGFVRIYRQAQKHENYRFAGENITIGDNVLRRGDRLSSADVGLLASLDYDRVIVYKQAHVSIISSGDELAEVGTGMGIGQIRNVNAYTLYSEVKKCNAIPHYLGISRDTLIDMKKIFAKALGSDVVISTGGVSAGKYDLVRDIYAELGIEIQFDRVNIKPGRPFIFGRAGNRLFFGLPGNPVPALICFIEFVRPALLKMMGATKTEKPVVCAIAEEDIRSVAVHHFVRGRFTIKDGDFFVSSAGNQKPSMLRSMSEANCLIILPETATMIKTGDRVNIQLIDHSEIS
ncbi:MAG TPA: gephyrin-like molybdotransferase Glp [Syntrophorhabdaceae bacterium]|nr:gephyrin-like molybdotransferase Glp [Syntrophorhabdaceae bacterium]